MSHPLTPDNLGLIKKTLDSLPDGVLVVASDRSVVYVNDKFQSMWDVPAEVVDTQDDNKLLDFIEGQVTDLESFREEVEGLYEAPLATETEIHLTDGRIFLRRGTFHVDTADTTAHIWVFSDITNLKAFERCSLTGVFNRRKFDEEFSQRLAAMKDSDVIGVALIDLDNFKQYNDRYGHPAGDCILSDIGRMFLNKLRRRGDTAYRIGGEEFLLICQSRSDDHIFRFIDKLRADVAEMGCEHLGNAPYNVMTFSAGIGFVQGNADADADHVLAQVDKALYEAKENGRNLLVKAQL